MPRQPGTGLSWSGGKYGFGREGGHEALVPHSSHLKMGMKALLETAGTEGVTVRP